MTVNEEVHMDIEHLMTRDVLTVSPETSLKEVARLLVEHRVSGVPVVENGRIVGVVSEADILFKEQGAANESTGPFAWLSRSGGSAAKLSATTAGEAMTSPPMTIEAGATAAAAARLMIEQGVNRLPVTADGALVGIVTRADLVRAFTRSDEEIAQEISEDVIFRTLWISPDRVQVSVTEGKVVLKGGVDTRTEAELVAAYVRRVPGVVDVDSSLGWSSDDLERRAQPVAGLLPG
jgi:CBS domain-containing protein